jgi:hypothetical protein
MGYAAGGRSDERAIQMRLRNVSRKSIEMSAAARKTCRLVDDPASPQ